jgi:ATP-dependent Lhr-like helicase
VQMRRTLPTDFAAGAGALDPEAIAQVAAEAWPVMRDADELHEALLALGVLPPIDGEASALFTELRAEGRVATLAVDGHAFWIAAERLELLRCVYPNGSIEPEIVAPPASRPLPDSQERCAAEILRGWLECSGPRRASEFAHDLAMPLELVDMGLAQLEGEGQILRGRFRHQDQAAEIEWCHRRLLARIHRLTIGRLRREIEPVTTAEFFAFLHRWQHLSPGSQLHGVDGTLQIIRQLQGCEFPGAAWESEVLPRRVAQYSPDYLDQLCLSGEVSWGRLSPHPAFEREEEENTLRRVRPTRVAPLAIFLREEAFWLLATPEPSPKDALSHIARAVLAVLETRGACFFTDLTRATGHLASEVEDALWELVAGGLVTADGFENLRALLDPKRRRGEGKGRTSRPRHAPGRWALLRHTAPPADGNAAAFAGQLLQRWGVVFRDVVMKETLAPAWRDLLVVLRKMESRGEIRGGRFVAAFIGEQFALPEALDLLRAIRREHGASDGPEALPAGSPMAAVAHLPLLA